MNRFSIVSLVLLTHALCAHAQHSSNGTPVYKYELLNESSKSHDVCSRMQRVFSDRFSTLWDSDPIWSKDDVRYSADSRYAFPRVNGTEHQARSTFDMRFSKIPSSPEFDAVAWREGRLLQGTLTVPSPILIAYLDFDNDGSPDTVIKVGFTGGYDYVTYGGNLFQEHLMVFRGETLNLSEVQQRISKKLTAVPLERRQVTATATYERPFLVDGRTYVAQYDEDLGGDFESAKKPPYHPLTEIMTVLSYSFSGSIESATGAPEWDKEILCTFKMTQVNKGRK